MHTHKKKFKVSWQHFWKVGGFSKSPKKRFISASWAKFCQMLSSQNSNKTQSFITIKLSVNDSVICIMIMLKDHQHTSLKDHQQTSIKDNKKSTRIECEATSPVTSFHCVWDAMELAGTKISSCLTQFWTLCAMLLTYQARCIHW